MSRCFPYPPPGYVSNRATVDALIESIKRDTERIKKEKKEQKRRNREERKKEKKREGEKFKSIQNIESTSKRKWDGDELEKSVDKSWVDSMEVHQPKKNETEAEQLESSISYEHGQPVLAESLSYSSDGTQSKANRIRMEQSPSNGNCATQGKSVRFRLTCREQESALPIDDVPSTSGRTSTPITKTFDDLPKKDEPYLNAHVPTADNDRIVVISIKVEASAHGRSDISPICNSSVEKTQKKPKSAYESLFSNWVPPPIHFKAVATIDDEQWMVQRKKQAGPNRLHSEFLNSVSCLSCSSAWPRAHLLPEADSYVLPFTVTH